MKCPKCGLPHANSDTVCRRCRVDLRSGEPVKQSALDSARAGGATRLDRLKALGAKRQQGESSLFSSSGERASEKPRRAVLSSSATKKKKRSLSAGLLGGKSPVKTLECLECHGSMYVKTASPYGLSGPLGLMVLAIAMVVAGFWAWPLFLLAPLSLGLGVVYIYLRSDKTRWECASCGFVIPRG